MGTLVSISMEDNFIKYYEKAQFLLKLKSPLIDWETFLDKLVKFYLRHPMKNCEMEINKIVGFTGILLKWCILGMCLCWLVLFVLFYL